jgi:2'-hydroxyisoflavone reductase
LDRCVIDRRGFLGGGAAILGLALAPACGAKPTPSPVLPTSRTRKILILGGTGFLGPKTIDAALARGHAITIFNRGKREKIQPLAHDVEHLYGNRDPKLPADEEHPEGSPKGLEQLAGRSWDVVIDNSGMYPRHVAASAELLAPHAERYIYISSISAYDESAIPPRDGDETAKLAELADPAVETMGASFENYGGLKVLCERAAAKAFGARAVIVRPGYIVGPGDPTDRFTYWPMRVARGGAVLAPGARADPLQWIDVRDLAEWLVALGERGTTGTFHAIGPTARWGDVLDACVTAAANDAQLEWIPADWLDKHGAGDDGAFPIWVAPTGKYAGFHRWSNARATAAGLAHRPVADTIAAIRAWFPGEIERRVRVTRELEAKAKAKGDDKPLPDPTKLRAGPDAAREAELLEKWRAEKHA